MSSNRPNVLVIDRSSGYHRLLRFALEEHYTVEHAYSAFLGETLLRERSFSLIIASLSLPRIYRGQGVLKAIRAIEGYGHVPVLGLVAAGEEVDEAEMEGFVGLIHDPSRIDDVRHSVQNALMVRKAA